MRTSYKTLTADEYNVLQVISSRTLSDCWFWLKQDKNGTDYIWDLEEQKKMCLKTGVVLLVEGVNCKKNYNNCRLTCFEDVAFRGLLKKLDIAFDVPYDGPSVIGMPMQDFVAYCKENDVRYKKYRNEFLVGDNIYQFDRDNKCFSVVSLNLDSVQRLASRKGLDEQIAAAKQSNDSRVADISKEYEIER